MRDVAVSFPDGRVAYVIVADGNAASGSEPTLHGVPLNALQLDATGRSFRLQADRKAFGPPGLDLGRLPAMPDLPVNASGMNIDNTMAAETAPTNPASSGGMPKH